MIEKKRVFVNTLEMRRLSGYFFSPGPVAYQKLQEKLRQASNFSGQKNFSYQIFFKNSPLS